MNCVTSMIYLVTLVLMQSIRLSNSEQQPQVLTAEQVGENGMAQVGQPEPPYWREAQYGGMRRHIAESYNQRQDHIKTPNIIFLIPSNS